MTHVLSPLPFPMNALEPFISKETIDYHYNKHHRKYVDKLNSLIIGTEFENTSLQEIVETSTGPIFNNASQVWNHDFYWKSLIHDGIPPHGTLLYAIEKQFSSLDHFYVDLRIKAENIFGSGWVWVIADKNGEIDIEATPNAINPIRHGGTPLLALDMWEHAYYLDYRNERMRYLDSTLHVLNWAFAERCYKETFLAAAC